MSMHPAHYPSHHHDWSHIGDHPLNRAAAWMLVFLAFGASIVLWRLSVLSSELNSTSTAPIVQVQTVVPGVRTAGAALDGPCSANFYLTGDLIGEANPALILAGVCGPR